MGSKTSSSDLSTPPEVIRARAWVGVLTDLAGKFGIPVVLLLALGYAGYRGTSETLVWAAENVARPLVVNHTKFLENQQEVSKRQAAAIEGVEKTLQGIHQVIIQQNQVIGQQNQRLENLELMIKREVVKSKP